MKTITLNECNHDPDTSGVGEWLLSAYDIHANE